MSAALSTIAGREIRALFVAPLAWSLLAVLQAILGYVYLVRLDVFLELQPRLAALPGAPGLGALVVAPLLRTAAFVLLLMVPLITMGLFAGERQRGTLTLLLSAPVGTTTVVLGKFLGVLALLFAALALSALLPLSLLLGAGLDWGQLAAGYAALAWLLASYAALGLLISSLCTLPGVAAVATSGLLLLLWALNWAGDRGAGVLAALSMVGHLDTLLRGLVDSRDVAYFALFIGVCIVFTVRRLEALRIHA